MSLSDSVLRSRAAGLALCYLLCGGSADALDPDTVILKATQVQPLVDGRYQVTLQWNALDGATYEVQGQEGLSQVGWSSFGLVTPATTTGAWTGTVAASLVDEGRFFMRLVLPQEKISAIEPAFVVSSGGVFYILGQCFTPTDRVFVNGVEATVVVFEGHTRLKVTVPATAAGVYDVEVRASDGATVHAKLTDSLTVNATGRSDEVPPGLPAGAPVTGRKGGYTAIGTGIKTATAELCSYGRDLHVPGRGLDFIWARTYRSKQGPSTAQGEGWDFSYNISATQSGGDVVVRDGEGRADTFFNQGDGTWSRPEFFRQGTMSGAVFTLMFADKGTWRFRAFDAPLAAGKIDRITDRNGNHLDFSYDAAGRLDIITDTLGRNYTVAYEHGSGRIESVTDFTGRVVTYGYNAAGDLTSVTSPLVIGTVTGNDFPTGKTTTFTYSSGFADARLNHNLLTVTSPLGGVTETFTYSTTLVPTDLNFDCCVRYTIGDASAPQLQNHVLLYYGPLTPTVANNFAITLTVINDHGNVTEVRSDSRNRPVEVRDYTGRSTIGVEATDVLNRPTGQLRPGDPPFFATLFDWNYDSLPVLVTLPRGGMIQNIFEVDVNAVANPRERGNLRVEVSTAAPATPSDFPTITRSWLHLPGFGSAERGPICGETLVDASDAEFDPPPNGEFPSGPAPYWPRPRSGLTLEDLNDCRVNNGGCATSMPRIWLDPVPDAPRLGAGILPPIIPPNAGGVVDLFDSNASKSGKALGVPSSTELYDAFRKALMGGASSAQPPPCFDAPGPGEGGLFDVPIELPRFKFEVGCAPGFSGSSTPRYTDPPKIEFKLQSPNHCPRNDTRGTMSFPTVYIDGRGATTTSGYDPNGNTTLINPPVTGTGHAWEYNPFGQPSAHIWPPNANGSARRDEIVYYSVGPQTGWPQSCVVDATGAALTTTYEYNTTGAVTRVIDPRGKDMLITRNALNQPVRIASREASAGVRYETEIRYDANDNVTSVDVQNKDETGAVVVTNPYFTTQYQYDSLNRPVRVIQEVDAPTTITTEIVRDPDNHRVTCRSPLAVAGTQPQNTVRVVFDERGLPFQTVLAPGAAEQSTAQYDYDLDGNTSVIRCGMELFPQVWLFEWDGQPQHSWSCSSDSMVGVSKYPRSRIPAPQRDYEQEPSSVETPNLVITAAESHAVPLYDWTVDGSSTKLVLEGQLRKSAGQNDGSAKPATPRAVTDPMGNKTTVTRDANGNTTAVKVEGEPTDVPGNAGNVRLAESLWTFDLLNRPTVWTGLLLDNAGEQTGSVSASTAYAPNSQPSSVTDPRGNVTTFGYDTANRLKLVTDAKTNTRAFAYDANSNLLSITATDKSDLGNPDQVFVITNTFDGLDRPLTRADNVGNIDAINFDSRSDIVVCINARGVQQRFVYDGLRRLLSTAIDMDNDGASATDPQDIVTSQTWDRNSRLATTTNANGFVTTHSYDSLNRPVGTLEADGTTSGTVAYDVFSNITQSTDSNGTVVVNTFDDLNRLIGRNIAPGPGVANTTTSESFTHDGLSRLKSATTNGSAPTNLSRTYDSLSRLLTETQGALTFACARDVAGNVSDFTYPGGNITTTTYDALNRPLSVTDSVSGAIITNAYIGPNRIERQTHGNGTITSYQYDGVQGIANAPGDSGWRQVRAKIVTGPGGTPIHDSRQYFYDANQNRVQRINVPIGLAHIHTLDNADRLVNTVVQQGGPPLRNTTYVLDKAGNRQNVSGTGTPNPGPYQMNPALPNPGDAQMNQYSLAPTGQFTYDDNGNRQNHNTGAANLQHVYDYANRLVAVNNLTTAQPVAVYQYDALSRRTQKVRFPGGMPTTTNFFFNGGNIIEERDGGGVVQATSFVSRIMEHEGIFYYNLAPAAVNRGGNLHTFHADPSGSIVCLTNAAGLPAERYDYQDFGEPQFFSAAYAPQTGSVLGNPILFCSYRFDTETGYIQIPRIGQEVIVDFAGGHGAGKLCPQDLSFSSGVDDTSSAGLMQGAAVGRSSGRNASNPSDVGGGEGYFDPKIGSWITRSR